MSAHDRSDLPPPIPEKHSWPAKVLYALLAIVLLAVGFFFVTVALVAGAIVALIILARLWWASRKLRRAQERTELEGEFTVVEQHASIRQVDNTIPDRGP